MTARGILHLPTYRTPHVLERDLRGHNSEPRTTGFPAEAVARLRAACQTQPRPCKEDNNDLPTAVPTVDPTSPPAPQPTRVVQVKSGTFPFPTMHGRKLNNREIGEFVCQHFASWYEWWRVNINHVTKTEMLALTGVNRSVWYRHEAAYRKNKRKYAPAVAAPPPVAQELPPIGVPTMHEFRGEGNAQKNRFIRAHFADWLAYKHAHHLDVQTAASVAGVAQSVWYSHQAEMAKNPGKYKPAGAGGGTR